MNSELNNAIKQKSKIRNIYNKWKSRENYLAWQNIKYKCKRLANKAEKDHFERIVSKGIMSNQEFWKKVKPALSETNPTNNTDIILEENGILERDHAKVTFWKSHALSSIKFVFLWSTIWALTKSFLKDLSINYRKQHFLWLTESKVIQG